MPNIAKLVEDIPTAPRSTDKSDVVVMSVLSSEQRHSTGTAHGYGREEIIVEDTLVDEMLVDVGKVFTFCKGTDVLIVRNCFVIVSDITARHALIFTDYDDVGLLVDSKSVHREEERACTRKKERFGS